MTIAIILTLPYLVEVIFALLLWKNAEFIGRRMVSEPEEENALRLGWHELYLVSMTIIGIYLLSEALPPLCFQLASLWVDRKVDFGKQQSARLYIGLINPVAKIILAMILIFGAKGLVRIIDQLREIVDRRLEARKVANRA
jgi:hypothetical protein